MSAASCPGSSSACWPTRSLLSANLFETQYVDFWMQVALLVLRVAALAIGIALDNFRLAIFLFAAVSTLVQSVQLLWYLFQVRRYDRKLLYLYA